MVLEVDASTSFGVFDPGLLGSKSADFVLQSLQVSSAGAVGAGPDTIALLGPAPPGGTAPRFVFHTMTSADSLFQGAQVIPVGYKISIEDTSTAKHVVRLTLWPITRLEQLGLLIP